MATTPMTTTTDVDQARDVVAAAHAANDRIAPADAALAQKMSQNVRGWTHTTRLRDFLESVNA